MKEIVRPDITAVYEHYQLRIIGRGGAWRKAQCPMPDHEDENPSASINEELGKWGCFSCDKRGDGIDIVREREGLDFREAVEWINRNIEGEKISGVQRKAGDLGRPRRNDWTPPWSRI